MLEDVTLISFLIATACYALGAVVLHIINGDGKYDRVIDVLGIVFVINVAICLGSLFTMLWTS